MKNFDKVGELISNAQRKLFGWIPYEEYRTMYPTETRDTIRGRVRRGVWQMGVHVSRGGAYDLWVHVANVKAWIEGRPPSPDLPPWEEAAAKAREQLSK